MVSYHSSPAILPTAPPVDPMVPSPCAEAFNDLDVVERQGQVVQQLEPAEVLDLADQVVLQV